MAQNPNWGSRGGGGFLRVLGIVYLIKIVRRRRERRCLAATENSAQDTHPTS